MIRAVEKLNGKVDLKIVGTGDLEIEFKKYIDNNKLSQVQLLGFKSGEHLYKLIREALFVVVPSVCYENNPMTIIESYCFGVPVIGSRIGGIPEIIDEGKIGFTYEMGNVDDLVVVLTKGINLSEEEYIKFKINARVFAEKNFSSNSHYEELMKLYKKTIEKTRFNDGQK